MFSSGHKGPPHDLAVHSNNKVIFTRIKYIKNLKQRWKSYHQSWIRVGVYMNVLGVFFSAPERQNVSFQIDAVTHVRHVTPHLKRYLRRLCFFFFFSFMERQMSTDLIIKEERKYYPDHSALLPVKESLSWRVALTCFCAQTSGREMRRIRHSSRQQSRIHFYTPATYGAEMQT